MEVYSLTRMTDNIFNKMKSEGKVPLYMEKAVHKTILETVESWLKENKPYTGDYKRIWQLI